MDPDDQSLLDRLLAGESHAAEEVGRWSRLAASSFRVRLGEDLEDVVQEALLELLEGLRAGKYRGAGSLRGYVWRSTVRNCLDRLRRGRRWALVEVDEETLAPVAPTALTRLLRTENRARLLSLVERLPRSCRDLWQEILSGRSYREMSRRFGVSEGALRVRVLRCRRRALELAERDRDGNDRAAGAP